MDTYPGNPPAIRFDKVSAAGQALLEEGLGDDFEQLRRLSLCREHQVGNLVGRGFGLHAPGFRPSIRVRRSTPR